MWTRWTTKYGIQQPMKAQMMLSVIWLNHTQTPEDRKFNHVSLSTNGHLLEMLNVSRCCSEHLLTFSHWHQYNINNCNYININDPAVIIARLDSAFNGHGQSSSKNLPYNHISLANTIIFNKGVFWILVTTSIAFATDLCYPLPQQLSKQATSFLKQNYHKFIYESSSDWVRLIHQ